MFEYEIKNCLYYDFYFYFFILRFIPLTCEKYAKSKSYYMFQIFDFLFKDIWQNICCIFAGVDGVGMGLVKQHERLGK